MKRILTVITLGLAGLALAACDPADFNDDYGMMDEIGFMAGCEGDDLNEEECQCIYTWFKENVPYATFTALADEPMPAEAADAISEAVGYCLGARTMPEPAPEPAS